MRTKFYKTIPCLCVLLPIVGSMYGQSEPEENFYELSPFTVETSGDTGYYATNTLAGTRLNSSLKDVSTPISIFTKELMDDVGATNLQEAMMYSVNVQNENEYAPDDTEGESISSTTQNRVRGIAGGTPTRGYFKSNYRADNYNTERLTIARGPNSILFGLGSPSGVLDATPVRAVIEKSFGSANIRTDNWGSLRGTIDLNVPVMADKIAVRVAAMDQNTKTFKETEYDDEKRFFMTATIKPFENTTIRMNYETMDNERVRARQALMTDRISDWIAAGKPLYDHTTGLWTQDGGNSWGENPALAGFVNTSTIGSSSRVNIVEGSLGGNELQGFVWEGTGLSYDPLKSPVRTFSDDHLVPSDVNYYGASAISKLAGDITTIVFEQKILENLYFEAAYNLENYSRDQDEGLRGGLSGIEADVNFYMPFAVGQSEGDRVVNPNRGRYMIQSQYLGYTQELQLETVRAMLSYEVDFSESNIAWLGRHNFGLMYQKEVDDNFKIKRRQMNTGDYWIGADGDSGLNNINSRYYLDIPSLGGDPAGVKTPTKFEAAPWDNVIGGIHGDGRPQQSRKEIEGKLFMMQSYLLEDSLVLTYGYRSDEQKAYATTFNERDPNTREFLYEGIGLDEDPNVQSGVTRTYGVVYHTPLDWLSLIFNRANTFNPQGDYFDWYGNPLPPGSGTGEDIGVNLDLFEGKLQAKLSFYENTSLDNVEFDWYYEEPKWSVMGDMDSTWGMVSVYADRLGNLEDINHVYPSDSIRATRDYESKGFELELFYKPTSNLDIRFTLSKTKAENLRVVPLLQEYVADRYAVWEKYFGYPAWGQWDWPLPEWDSNWMSNPASTGYQMINGSSKMPRVDEFAASEGTVTSRGRKWRSNLIVNYRLSDKFEGLSVGGAARYRSPETIGYGGRANPRNPEGLQVTDVTKPIEGDAIFEVDAWVKYERKITVAQKDLDWIVQLNVRNLFNDDDITPTQAYTDGSYTTFIRKTPRTFILTNTIKF